MKKIFKIKGMHCSSCEKIIEMELEGKVKSCKADSKKGEVFVDFEKISEGDLIKIIENSGYEVLK